LTGRVMRGIIWRRFHCLLLQNQWTKYAIQINISELPIWCNYIRQEKLQNRSRYCLIMA